VDDRPGLDDALAALGAPAVLKTRRFGYDGKGQARIAKPSEAAEAWRSVGGAPSILESFVAFDFEFSILLCRGLDGAAVTWPAPRNTHEDGVLRRSQVPARGLEAQVAEAEALALKVAEALDYVGVLALEFFATPGGPLFNEMAPRVHNSGHWTVEGAVTSQFENHVRAVCGLPLGATGLTGARVEMENLIGGEANGWAEILSDPAAHLHLYGKGEARPGRKMGHVTRVW
jgi:5-(carboxyamino)imidazole ribonucleotide synthase